MYNKIGLCTPTRMTASFPLSCFPRFRPRKKQGARPDQPLSTDAQVGVSSFELVTPEKRMSRLHP